MKKGVIALLACVFALSLALVGCGGGSGADAKAAWVGTWDLVEMEENGQVTGSEDLEMLKSLGLDVYLELNQDGTGALVLFGEAMNGKWDAKSATEATFTIENQTIDMKIADSKLNMEQNGSKLTFQKGQARSSSAASASASAAAASASSAAASASSSASSASSSSASWSVSPDSSGDAAVSILPIVVADNDDVSIVVDAVKVDSAGDPGYVVSIANKTPGKVYVYSGIGWKAKGSDVDDPVLREIVDPGQAIEGFMWFDRRSLGSSSTEALEDVKGSIVVEDHDTGAIIGEYAFMA